MQFLYHESEKKNDGQVVAALASCNSEIEAEAVIQQGLEEPWIINLEHHKSEVEPLGGG